MSLFKNQRGVAAIAIVLIVVVCLALIGGILYFALKKDGKLPLVGSKFNDQCAYDDKELCKYLNNYTKAQKNLTAISVTTHPDNFTSGSTYIADGDNFQIIGSTNGKEDYNYIAIGDTTYTKDYSDNVWVKQTSSPDAEEELKSENEFTPPTSDEESPQASVTYAFVAQESCGDLTCLKYQVSVGGDSGTEFIWFDTEDYLIRKQITELDGIKTETAYTYEKTTVSAPSPTKDTPAAPNVSIPDDYNIPQDESDQYMQINS